MNKIVLAGCVILKDNSILLIKRIKTGWYELPGGKIDEGELPKETAKRELKEELLCDVEIIKKIGIGAFEIDGRKFSYHWFLAKVIDNQIPKIGEPADYSEIKFIPIKSLLKFKLSPNVQKLMPYLDNFKYT